MFQMVNDEKPGAEDRKMMWVKIGVFLLAMAAFGGVIWFFAFVPYTNR